MVIMVYWGDPETKANSQRTIAVGQKLVDAQHGSGFTSEARYIFAPISYN
jgi:hypothetical protein